MSENLEVRRDRIKKVTQWAFIGLAAAIAAPIAFLAFTGIWLIAACAVSVMVIVNFAPAVGTYLANKKIQALVAAVEANPIETMQNLYIDKKQDLETADQNIVAFETEIRTFDDQLDAFTRNYPARANAYEELSVKMHLALKGMKDQQSETRAELVAFNDKIKEAKAIYAMARAAQNVVKLSSSAEAQVFAQIKEQVSFDTVRSSLNQAFANLDLALQRRNDARAFSSTVPQKALAATPTTMGDVPVIVEKSAVRR